MSIPFVEQIIFIFKLLFMSSKELKDTKRSSVNASLIVVGITIVIAIIVIFLSLVYECHYRYQPQFTTHLNWPTIWVTAILACILIVVYVLSTILIFNRLAKDSTIKIEISSCESKFCSMVGGVYPHAKGYITKQFSNSYKDHKHFAEDISSIRGIEKRQLTDIAKDAENSIHGRFSCVLSDARYYPPSTETIAGNKEAKEIIEYFINFEKYTENNHVTRIFTWNQKEQEYSAEIFLQYLLTNTIAGMDTYVLFISDNASTGSDRNDAGLQYFPYIDYVISDIVCKESRNRETKVYFSCDISEEETDKVVVSNDNFLLHLLETDFANRLDMKKGRKSLNHCTKLSKITFREVLVDIGLVTANTEEDEYKRIINSIIKVLEQYILANTVNSDLKSKLVKRLNDWVL